MRDPIRLAILVSGGGSNLQAILDAENEPGWPAKVVSVISSRPGVKALDRAHKRQVPTQVIDKMVFGTEDAFQKAVLSALEAVRPDLICLAGYLRKLSPAIIQRFRGRILNIHPALLPKFGGAGMYGHHVHEAVVASGERESGCSVHLVDEEFDHGAVLAQARVPVHEGETPETLAARVLAEEHRLYPLVIKDFCKKLKAEKS